MFHRAQSPTCHRPVPGPALSWRCRDRDGGGKVVEAELAPGLYAFAVDADGREFDWEVPDAAEGRS